MNLSTRSVERLNKLADILVEVPKYIDGFAGNQITTLHREIDDFDMGAWGCGTSACAAGIAMIHPWFRKRGLRYFIETEANAKEGIEEERSPMYKEFTEGDALREFFGIDNEAVNFLFMPGSYPLSHQQPGYVADRIRKFAKRDGKIVSTIFKQVQERGF